MTDLGELTGRLKAQSEAVAKNPRMKGRKAEFVTSSGIEMPRVFSPLDSGGTAELPGEAPYTRGVHPTMYRSRFWTMRQYAGFGDADESNRRYRMLLDKGTTGLSVAFDLPTQMGRDSDHPLAEGEVGKVGVAIDSLEDMQRLFAQIPLGEVSTSMTINSTAAILISLYAAVAETQGVEQTALRGTVQNDILKEYMARGTYVYPPGPSMRIITDLFAYASKEWPNWNTISISGYHIREAGSTAVQELAFTLADGIAYVQAAVDAGLHVDAFAPRLSFFFNVHNNFLEEVSKFRAARRMWAKIMKERFSANERSCQLRFHSQTAGSTLTAQQPDVNVVRVTLQALAAVLGGTQSLHTNSRDEALALPSEQAATLALRTQQVIANETGVADVADPFGGSYAVEALTDEIERRAFEYIQRIDESGGMVRAIEDGFPQREIEQAAYDAQRAIESGESVVVGVNRFTENDAAGLDDLMTVDPALEGSQKARLADLRKRRDGQAAAEACRAVEATARGSDNLIPKIRAAVSAYATVGEISDAMRAVFGEHRPTYL